MRTITTAQNEVLTRGKYKVALKVEIEDPDGVLVDVSSFEGVNWIRSVERSENVDDPVVTARVKLFARKYNLSMHPLDEDSKINRDAGGAYDKFLDVRRQIRVLTATVPQDYTPVSGDFELVFDGFIDKVPEPGKRGNSITLECRDEGGFLQDTWIEDLERYGDGSVDETDHVFADLEDITQEILDNWTSGITLFSENGTGGTPFLPGDTPAFNVEAWDVDIQSILDAIRIGANSIGWECRYRWQDNVNDFELQLYEPDRASVSVERTFGPSNYIDITALDVDVSRVRNAIEVTFYTDPEDDQTKTTIEVTDAASIARYGRRWMGIVEAQSSAINSAGEATRMADAILSDLREPDRNQEVDMHYFWAAQLGDRYTFSANDVNYTTDQTWAVVGIRDVLTPTKQRTFIETSRAPSGGSLHWWDRAQLGGIGDILKDKIPTPPVVSLDLLDHGVLVEWTNPQLRLAQIAYYEVHVSTTATFTPGPSTLLARVRGTRHRAMGLDQETTYFFKVLSIDREGNISTNSNEVSSIPGYLRGFPGRIETTLPAAGSLQPGQMVFLQNGSFAQRKYKTYLERLLTIEATEPHFTYGLDEGAGPTATDDSSNGNDGTYNNTGNLVFSDPPAIEDGGSSIDFRDAAAAASGNVSLTGQALTPDSFSFLVWFKREVATPTTSPLTLINVEGTATSNEFRLRWLAAAPNNMEIFINSVTASLTGKKVVNSEELDDRTWIQLVVTWDNTAGDLKVYINDVEVDSLTGVQTAVTLDFDDFEIGAEGGNDGLDARLDRPTMWIDEVLTLAQVKELFYAGRAVDTDFDEARIESGGGVGGDQARHVPFFVAELSDNIQYSLSGWVNSAFGRVLVDPWQMFDKQTAITIGAATQGSSPITIPVGWEGYWQFGYRLEVQNYTSNSQLLAGIAIDVNGTGFPGGAGGNPQYWGVYAEVTPTGNSGTSVWTPPVFMQAGGQAKPKHFSQSDSNYQMDRTTTNAILCHFWGRYLFQKRSLDRGTF